MSTKLLVVPVLSNLTWSPLLSTTTAPGPTSLMSPQHPHGPRLHFLLHSHVQEMNVQPSANVQGAIKVQPSKTLPESKFAPGP